MMERVTSYWQERSPRERWLLGIMIVLMVLVLLWLGVVRPVTSAQRSSREAMLEAIDRNAAIRARVKLLRQLPASASGGLASGVPVDQLLGQSAGEAGLTLSRAQAQGEGRADIAIADIRPVALMSWLSALEAQGVRVETLSARPSATAGSIMVEAVLVREGGR